MPRDISNLSVAFTLDENIKKLSGNVKWKITSPKQFVRLALKHAILGAKAEVELRSEDWIAKNKRIAVMAKRAHAAIDRTIRDIAPKATSSDMLVAPIFDTRAKKASQNPRTLRDSASEDANNLWLGRVALKQISDDAQHRQKEIAQMRQNPGDPDKRVFVHTLAEAWCTLFGEPPLHSPENNPFIDFVRAAWKDAGQNPETDFSRALRSAHKAITVNDLDILTSVGPDWLASENLS